MRRRIPIAFALVVVLAFPAAAQSDAAKKRIARGKYLVTIAGCHDCHSPKVDEKATPDWSLSGRPASTQAPSQTAGEIHTSMDLTAWSGPWGISYAANLTPDPETGLGRRYDEAKFIKAIRTGTKPEGEPILPPMPWPMYSQMTDDDLKSVWAYLKTLKPVKNNVRVAAPAAARSN